MRRVLSLASQVVPLLRRVLSSGRTFPTVLLIVSLGFVDLVDFSKEPTFRFFSVFFSASYLTYFHFHLAYLFCSLWVSFAL